MSVAKRAQASYAASAVSGDHGVGLGVDDRNEGRGEPVPESGGRLDEAGHARRSRASSPTTAVADHSLTATTASTTAIVSSR